MNDSVTPEAATDPEDRSLLLADDDQNHSARTTRALEARGFRVAAARSLAEARARVTDSAPAFAVVEARLGDGAGLSLVEVLRSGRPGCRVVILTASLLGITQVAVGGFRPMTADRARWEHIHRVLEHCDYNISETARRLGLHRRTLQRILAKHAPR